MTVRATFRQGDIKRAMKGVIAAGGKVERVEIDQAGKIVIYTAPRAANDVGPSDWD